jgi:hypothetical protein
MTWNSTSRGRRRRLRFREADTVLSSRSEALESFLFWKDFWSDMLCVFFDGDQKGDGWATKSFKQ